MRVLVTGASGFIGRHVVRALEDKGHALTIAERTPGSVAHETDWHDRHRIATVGDIHGTTDWHAAFEDVEAVVHLAAHAHVMNPTEDDEAAFWQTNVHGTDRLATQAVISGVTHFVLMSSIGAVAASCDTRVTRETPCRPVTAYGRSKLGSEEALVQRAHGTDMGWTVLRPTLVYGRDNPGNMKRLISLVNSGLPLPIGAIHNRRSFTYVENVADLVAHTLGHRDAMNQVFLVGDGEDLSTPELVRRIAALSGRRVRIFSVPSSLLRGVARGLDAIASATSAPLPAGSDAIERLSASLFVDGDDVRRKLDWSPPFGMDAGLRCMLSTP